MATVLALLMVTVLIALAVAMASASFLEFSKSNNISRAIRAQLAAESGMAFMQKVLRDVELPNAMTAGTVMAKLNEALAAELGSAATLAGRSITNSGTTISIPQIVVGADSFSCQLVQEDPDDVGFRLTVTGASGGISRRVSVAYLGAARRSGIFDYGLASRGKISISGSATVDGMTDARESNVFSCSDQMVAIEAGGNATIGGDLFVTSDTIDNVVLTGGSLTVGGVSGLDRILEEHVHPGASPPEFPETDTAQFAHLPTSIVDANTTLTNPGQVFDNILIKADTNPDFTADTVINGIIYVEAPNKVTFHANVTLNAMIVTEDAGGLDIQDCQIDFRGRVTAPGVGALPDTAEFADVKQYTGTVLLAPGFEATFRGSTNSINGTIAADQMTFRGTSSVSGNVTGSIVGLSDKDMGMHGNTTIRVNIKGADSLPAGFKHPVGLAIDAGTYSEPTGAGD